MKVLRKIRWKPLLILLGLVGLGAGLAVFLMPRQPQLVAIDPREQWQAQQQVVSSVMQSANRDALIGTSPTQGRPDAEIILFEFSDFQCPFCARASLDVKILLDEYGDDLLLVYKHLPLTQIHPEAMPAARAAWAAGQQGQFWLYHDGLFANQVRLGDALYVELAQQIGLDLDQFNRDRNGTASLTAIQRDLQLAQRLQISSTPTFLINDLLMPPGAPLSFFRQTLDQIKEALAARDQPPN